MGSPSAVLDTSPMAGWSSAKGDTCFVSFWLDVKAGGWLVWPLKPSPAMELWAIATEVLTKPPGRAWGCLGPACWQSLSLPSAQKDPAQRLVPDRTGPAVFKRHFTNDGIGDYPSGVPRKKEEESLLTPLYPRIF